MKIRKDPYCVNFHLGFTPHSTQCWVTQHNSSVNRVTDKPPFHTILVLFANIVAKHRLSSMLENENSKRPILCWLSSRIYPPIPYDVWWPYAIFLWMELLIKPPFHTVLVLFANILADHGLSHTSCCVILNFIPISHTVLLQISPPFCVHTISHNFCIFYPHSTPNSFRAHYFTFGEGA